MLPFWAIILVKHVSSWKPMDLTKFIINWENKLNRKRKLIKHVFNVVLCVFFEQMVKFKQNDIYKNRRG